ncbi:hypothetical protein ACIHFE_28685 [Streptomyces sp. NPDC052396]|uniref:hypothetical protein n=1 Tax=Streptomyces sp. NPDC052396 TaxID=3365689 RepID=UPI0037D94394
MAEPEFTATGVRIDKPFLRSLTRAGQVKIHDGRLELLTSYGREIDSAPVDTVHASKPWFALGDRARAVVNGTRYLLTLGPGAHSGDEPAASAVDGFLEAVRSARGEAAPGR